jgi:hypothetical protein
MIKQIVYDRNMHAPGAVEIVVRVSGDDGATEDS